MGRRRARLLKERPDVEVCGVDRQEARQKQAQEELGIVTYSSVAEAEAAAPCDCAFISASPLSHAALIRECLEAGLHVFTEINLVADGYEENMALAREKGLVLFLSSDFLYRKETQTLIRKVQEAGAGKMNYLYHVGQYLPDWHPWEDYRTSFLGQVRTNACREILVIDLPWIVTAFGEITDAKVMKSRNTQLDIAFPDSYLVMLEHASGAKGVFAVDVVSRKPVRHFEAYGEKLHLDWDGEPDGLYVWDLDTRKSTQVVLEDAAEHREGYAAFVTENPYREEINAFFRTLADPNYVPAWDFEKDGALLRWIDKIES